MSKGILLKINWNIIILDIKFDIIRLQNITEKIISNEIIKLDDFLDLNVEFTRLFGIFKLYYYIDILGSGFSFATSDVVKKIGNLKDRRREMIEIGKIQCKPENVTIQQLFEIDKEMGVERSGDRGWNGKGKFYHAASRTILRLTWFLDFLYEIINQIYLYRNKELSVICRESYHDALAKHHPWYIRAAFSVLFRYIRLQWLLVLIKKPLLKQ